LIQEASSGRLRIFGVVVVVNLVGCWSRAAARVCARRCWASAACP